MDMCNHTFPVGVAAVLDELVSAPRRHVAVRRPHREPRPVALVVGDAVLLALAHAVHNSCLENEKQALRGCAKADLRDLDLASPSKSGSRPDSRQVVASAGSAAR